MIPHFVTAPFLVFKVCQAQVAKIRFDFHSLEYQYTKAKTLCNYVNNENVNNVYEIDARLEVLSLVAL